MSIHKKRKRLFLKQEVFMIQIFKKMSHLLSDKTYLKLLYYHFFRKHLNLKNPITFNEKIQWLKIYDRKDLYTTFVDKYLVKEYVAKIIGEDHIIPTLGLWDKFEDIDFSILPNKFVLKCTHDSGGLVICHDKKTFDYASAKKIINKSLKTNFYWVRREWPYKNVKPRIIAEQYMEDDATKDLRDYKFFCFNGSAKALFIATDRQNNLEETKFDFFDINFNHLPIKNGHPNADVCPSKPKTFDEMIRFAELLSKNIPHLRCDFYEVNGKVYFGELTFSHFGGMVPFEPEEWDKVFGSWIMLPKLFK